MAHRARYSGRPALRPSGHQHKTLMFKIAPCNFASHSASSPEKQLLGSGSWVLGPGSWYPEVITHYLIKMKNTKVIDQGGEY
jgi:hypothetical protein